MTWKPGDKIRFINSAPETIAGWERYPMKITNPTPENVRFHAAGHIAAAGIAALDSPDAARAILLTVLKYVDDPKVNAPPQLREKLAAAAEDPCNHLMDITILEMWFCDPLNTVLERGGM